MFSASLVVFSQDLPICICILSMEYWATQKQWLCWCWAGDLLWDKHQIHVWCLFSWNHGQHKHTPHATTALLLRNALKFQILFLFFLPAPVWMTAVLLPTEMSADPAGCFPLKCLFLGKYYIWGCFASGFPTWSLYNRSMPCWEIRGILAASAVCCCEMPPCSSLISCSSKVFWMLLKSWRFLQIEGNLRQDVECLGRAEGLVYCNSHDL